MPLASELVRAGHFPPAMHSKALLPNAAPDTACVRSASIFLAQVVDSSVEEPCSRHSRATARDVQMASAIFSDASLLDTEPRRLTCGGHLPFVAASLRKPKSTMLLNISRTIPLSAEGNISFKSRKTSAWKSTSAVARDAHGCSARPSSSTSLGNWEIASWYGQRCCISSLPVATLVGGKKAGLKWVDQLSWPSSHSHGFICASLSTAASGSDEGVRSPYNPPISTGLL
mmetsp:Transcript_10689/g.21687  ORF Transcript_10689/g.21687 Transcript_10689/m.21687 type:complete len:229 (-) Transcript_10689:1314-2000(-)